MIRDISSLFVEDEYLKILNAYTRHYLSNGGDKWKLAKALSSDLAFVRYERGEKE